MDIDLIPDDAKTGDVTTDDVNNGDATTADTKDDPKSDDAKTTDGNKEAAKLLETVALWLTQYIQVINLKYIYFSFL